MIKYAKIVNSETGLCDAGLGTNSALYESIGMTLLDIKQSDVDGNWYLTELCPMKSEEEKQREEAERKAMLNLTRGDVFAALIEARMMDENTLRAQLELLPEETLEQKKLKMLSLNALTNALNFHRGHPLVNTIGEQLNISEENLDLFFETNDYHYLLPESPSGRDGDM